jgi:hypothetical protein
VARFQIVTDIDTHTEGDTTDAFKDLGHTQAVLQSYKEVGNWVELSFSGGLTVAIPEARIQYIAETTT